MKRFYYYLLIVFVFLVISGCGARSSIILPRPIVPMVPMTNITYRPIYGFLYTHTTRSLDVNMNKTPSGILKSSSDVKHLAINVYLQFMWDDNTIAEIAKKGGIETVYYADIETFSILGIWNQYSVHIYGK